MVVQGKKDVTIVEEITKTEEASKTTEETIIRFSNVRRPKKANSLNLMTDSKQSLVGDYSCCSRVP